MTKKLQFESSTALKQFLAEPLENWKRKKGDYNELAEKCGVTPAYLSQLKTYGRVPGRSVLILLAFNLDLKGQDLFHAAGIMDPFPFTYNSTITERRESQNDIIRFDSGSFASLIKDIVRNELKQKNINDLLKGRPLRIGLNYHQYWLFGSEHPPANKQHTGFFPELCAMLALALQKEIELVYVPFADFTHKLANGEIDVYGPTQIIPTFTNQLHYSTPIYKLGVSGLMRKKAHPSLDKMEMPESSNDLRDGRYKIAVLRNSLPHLIVNTKLQRPDESLILCSSDEEGIERVAMKGLNRPAHIFITNSMTAILNAKKNPKELTAIFQHKNDLLDLANNGLAIRRDWPELVTVLNDAIRFLQTRNTLPEKLIDVHKGELQDAIQIINN